METTPISTTERLTKLRWFHPTPARLLVILLVIEAILLLSEQWFPKGWTVLIAIAAVGITMALMLIWWLAALCFRWRFQFSLRSLLVATVAVAIPFSWLAVEMKKMREQRAAVEWVKKMGVYIRYDYQPSNGTTNAPLGPVWLRKLFGDDFFANVSEVQFNDTQLTDTGLERIKGLSELQGLSLTNTQVTDTGLEHLKGLTKLAKLSVNRQVTDAGLDCLKGLPHLQWLSLSRTQITDAGLERLKRLSELQYLFLYNTHVTERGVKELQQALPNCKIYGPQEPR